MGISVDPPTRNAAMVEKLGLPFPLLSDPRGDLIQTLGLWNAGEGVSEPAIVVLDGTATIRHLYSGGSDFSDRPPGEALLRALDEVGTAGEPEGDGPRLRISAEEAEGETVRPDRPALGLDALQPYYMGTYFATVAMQKKLDGGARAKVDAYQDLVNEYNAAIRETVEKAS